MCGQGRAHVEGAIVWRVDALQAAQHLDNGRQARVQLRQLCLAPLAIAPPLRAVAQPAVRKLLLHLRPDTQLPNQHSCQYRCDIRVVVEQLGCFCCRVHILELMLRLR